LKKKRRLEISGAPVVVVVVVVVNAPCGSEHAAEFPDLGDQGSLPAIEKERIRLRDQIEGDHFCDPKKPISQLPDGACCERLQSKTHLGFGLVEAHRPSMVRLEPFEEPHNPCQSGSEGIGANWLPPAAPKIIVGGPSILE
jgi:hypothetical protein